MIAAFSQRRFLRRFSAASFRRMLSRFRYFSFSSIIFFADAIFTPLSIDTTAAVIYFDDIFAISSIIFDDISLSSLLFSLLWLRRRQ